MAITPAQIIERRRAELGLSQAQLAERLGRTPSTVRRWEQGEAVPPVGAIEALASALDVAPRDLAVAFGIEEPETAPEPEVSPPPPSAAIAEQPTEAIAVPAEAATAVATAPRRSAVRKAPAVDPGEGLSYIEDSRQRMRYWLRAALTIVIGIILLVILFWAFGELRQAIGEVWDLFGDDAPPATSPGTDF